VKSYTSVFGILHLALLFFPVLLGRAQTTTYFSNLGQTPVGSLSIGSNAWCAQEIITGTNSGGYLLNSIQLQLGTPTATPSGFSLAIYERNLPGGFIAPGSLLESLTGTVPSGSGVFTFQSSGLVLNPKQFYFIVATATTPVTSAAYRWEITPWTQPAADSFALFGTRSILYQSTDGLTWKGTRPNNFMFAINATAVPEPSSLVLLGLGGSFLFTSLARKSRSRALSQP
jgi:hypothetical protein